MLIAIAAKRTIHSPPKLVRQLSDGIPADIEEVPDSNG
jgi:hypothetical protein